MDKRYFSEKVAEWYLENKRDLPWRTTSDPYKIWLSEIILQQTRVIQGLPYYEKFISRFPNVFALAAASQQEVLRLWQGLGYYTRARNLHKCAKEVVSRHGGNFPGTYAELLQLPGIGEYTAAAIASFCFNESVAVVDGNVFRVLARIFGVDTAINSPLGKKLFTELANEIISPTQPARHNQAMMEFGALFCTPKNPKCDQCAFVKSCFAANREAQHMLPVKAKTKKSTKRFFYYFVLKKENTMAMKKREGKDIWHGLFDFLLVERTRPTKTDVLLKEFPDIKKAIGRSAIEVSKVYRHILSHQTIDARFIVASISKLPMLEEPDELKLYSRKKIAELPKPVLISRFLTDYPL